MTKVMILLAFIASCYVLYTAKKISDSWKSLKANDDWDAFIHASNFFLYSSFSCRTSTQLDIISAVQEVQEYFTNYKEPDKAMSNPCIELAKNFSIVDDFPETGVPAEIPPHLHVKEYPDFMEKLEKPTYESRNVIGKLFREVRDIAPDTSPIKSFTEEVGRRSYDRDMEVDGFEDHIEDAFYYKSNYDYKLGNLMDYYGIRTEAEILSGGILKMSKSFTKRRDAEAIGMAVRALRKEARAWFNEKGSGSDFEDDVYAKASAWYHVTYHPNYWGSYNVGLNRQHFLSFAWCVYDKLIEIKRDKTSLRNALSLSSLQHSLSHGLLLH
ncbi:RNA-dependent RNA polymerase 1-like [Pistacia vera]|uniref:RNA-dependent RNA polymerase 1-like n=1 Tax=Pistacia vera TaxID=55513 RepID=UPI001262AD3D|nr:RNA-dependent RNA polymerase 1-like [Pistacia vera]